MERGRAVPVQSAQHRDASAAQVVDEYETPFGIREALFDADNGFLLNGEHVKLNGVCLHHEAGIGRRRRAGARLGAPPRNSARDGLQRHPHQPQSVRPEFLDLCDRMGFLVMNEAFDEWKVGKGQVRGNGYRQYFDEWHERDVTDFVHRDRNHPCVVLWSCGNEIGDQSSPDGAEILRKLLDIFHAEDPTRLVTAGCDQIASEPKAGSASSFSPARRGRLQLRRPLARAQASCTTAIDKLAHPNWRIIGTESGGMGGTRGDYRGMVPLARRTAPPARAGSPADCGRGGFGLRPRISRARHRRLWRFVRTHDYVAGDFMWTGIDYLGESGWPDHGATAGVHRHLRLPQGRLLLLPEPVDR